MKVSAPLFVDEVPSSCIEVKVNLVENVVPFFSHFLSVSTLITTEICTVCPPKRLKYLWNSVTGFQNVFTDTKQAHVACVCMPASGRLFLCYLF